MKLNSLAAKKSPVTLEFEIELEFRNLGYLGGKKTELRVTSNLVRVRSWSLHLQLSSARSKQE